MSWGNIPSWANNSALALMQALNYVEPLTYDHCCRVGNLSRKLASSLGLNEFDQALAEYSGLFHDLGKIGIGQDIIGKPGKLDPRELDIMRNHSSISESILKPLASKDAFFRMLLAPVRGHHERVDGEGYPDRLMGDKIHLLSRVILVVDTYDAMSQSRPYRKGLPDDVIYAELKRCSGTQFDAQIVRVFLESHKFWTEQQTHENSVVSFLKKAA
jgi:putative nucleotidyltransferase with HDIG domain